MENETRPTRQNRRTPEEIKALMDKFEASGKTAQQFITEERLTPSSFWRWRQRRKASSSSEGTKFVEVGPEALAPLSSVLAQVRFRDGLSIELKSGFGPEQLAQLIERLRK